jgi:transcriptional regulator with GAF, ATPase, and Fis domain
VQRRTPEIDEDVELLRRLVEGTAHSTGEEFFQSPVLTDCQWVIEGPNGAAKILGLHPNTLRSRMKKLGIHR